jgi:hypothetical protein
MLQDIEDRGEGTPLAASVFKILYATADGFEAAANEGGKEVFEAVQSSEYQETY